MEIIVPVSLRGDTATNWQTVNPVLLPYEAGYDVTARRFKMGDGVTPWNTLPYTGEDPIFRGSFVPGTYAAGQFVEAADGIAYMALRNQTTAAQPISGPNWRKTSWGDSYYQGDWNPNTNTPALSPSGVGVKKGQVWRVSEDTNNLTVANTTAAAVVPRDTQIVVASATNIVVGAVMTSSQPNSTTLNIPPGTVVTIGASGNASYTYVEVNNLCVIPTGTPLTFTANVAFAGLTDFVAGDLLVWNGVNWDLWPGMNRNKVAFTTLPYSPSVTWRTGGAPVYNAQLNLAYNVTLSITKTRDGVGGTLLVVQDGNGNHTLTPPLGSVGFEQPKQEPNAFTLYRWIYHSGTYYWSLYSGSTTSIANPTLVQWQAQVDLAKDVLTYTSTGDIFRTKQGITAPTTEPTNPVSDELSPYYDYIGGPSSKPTAADLYVTEWNPNRNQPELAENGRDQAIGQYWIVEQDAVLGQLSPYGNSDGTYLQITLDDGLPLSACIGAIVSANGINDKVTIIGVVNEHPDIAILSASNYVVPGESVTLDFSGVDESRQPSHGTTLGSYSDRIPLNPNVVFTGGTGMLLAGMGLTYTVRVRGIDQQTNPDGLPAGTYLLLDQPIAFTPASDFTYTPFFAGLQDFKAGDWLIWLGTHWVLRPGFSTIKRNQSDIEQLVSNVELLAATKSPWVVIGDQSLVLFRLPQTVVLGAAFRKNLLGSGHEDIEYGDGHNSNVYGNDHQGNRFGANHSGNRYQHFMSGCLFADDHQYNDYGSDHTGNSYETGHSNNVYGNTHVGNVYGDSHSYNRYGSGFQRNVVYPKQAGNVYGNNVTDCIIGAEVYGCRLHDDTQFLQMGTRCRNVVIEENCSGSSGNLFVIPDGTTNATYRNGQLVPNATGSGEKWMGLFPTQTSVDVKQGEIWESEDDNKPYVALSDFNETDLPRPGPNWELYHWVTQDQMGDLYSSLGSVNQLLVNEITARSDADAALQVEVDAVRDGRYIIGVTGTVRTYLATTTAFKAAIASLVSGETMSLPRNGKYTLTGDIVFPSGVRVIGNDCQLSTSGGLGGTAAIYTKSSVLERVKFFNTPNSTFGTCIVSAIGVDFISCGLDTTQVETYDGPGGANTPSTLRFIDCTLNTVYFQKTVTLEWRGTTKLTSVSSGGITGQVITINDLRPDKAVRTVNGTAPDAGGNVNVSGGTTSGANIDYANPVTHTGNTTLDSTAFGKVHVFVGTTADLYNIALPDPTGNAGKPIAFRVEAAATGMWALQGTDIDGYAEQRMWALETAELVCTGTGYRKRSRSAIALSMTLGITGAVSMSSLSTLLFDHVVATNAPASMFDSVNAALRGLRRGLYVPALNGYGSGSDVFAPIECIASLNGDYSHPYSTNKPVVVTAGASGSGTAYASLELVNSPILLQAGQFLNVRYYSAGTMPVLNSAATIIKFSLTETTPLW